NSTGPTTSPGSCGDTRPAPTPRPRTAAAVGRALSTALSGGVLRVVHRTCLGLPQLPGEGLVPAHQREGLADVRGQAAQQQAGVAGGDFVPQLQHQPVERGRKVIDQPAVEYQRPAGGQVSEGYAAQLAVQGTLGDRLMVVEVLPDVRADEPDHADAGGECVADTLAGGRIGHRSLPPSGRSGGPFD